MTVLEFDNETQTSRVIKHFPVGRKPLIKKQIKNIKVDSSVEEYL
jgi:hypothetical protein